MFGQQGEIERTAVRKELARELGAARRPVRNVIAGVGLQVEGGRIAEPETTQREELSASDFQTGASAGGMCRRA